MATPTDDARDAPRGPRPNLDGAHPLLNTVVREVAVKAGETVVRQGDVPHTAHLLLEGQTCRYRLLGDGRRQITAILIPGDICDLEAVMRGRVDCSVEALVPCVLGEMPAERLDGLGKVDADVQRALWRQVLRDEAIGREWMVVLGRRSALERVAHLLCELRERMRRVGLGEDGTYDLHLTQNDLADALGLSTVYTNRTLQRLRHDGVIELRKSVLRVLDAPALVQMADFDPAYLEPAAFDRALDARPTIPEGRCRAVPAAW